MGTQALAVLLQGLDDDQCPTVSLTALQVLVSVVPCLPSHHVTPITATTALKVLLISSLVARIIERRPSLCTQLSPPSPRETRGRVTWTMPRVGWSQSCFTRPRHTRPHPEPASPHYEPWHL